jgi:hypothetical protein
MAVHFRVRTTDSRPERVELTKEIELRKKQQAESDRKATLQPAQKQAVEASR